jgi:hypothetical protein
MSINLNDNNRGGTFCLGNAGLAIGSTKSQVAIAAPNGAGVDYCIKGISYHKADAATIAITAAAAQPVLTTCLYLVCLNASGTLSTVKGRAVLNAALANGTDVLEWPTPVAGTCPIGALKVKCANAATFTANTTLHDATDVTVTYINLTTVPTEPLTA